MKSKEYDNMILSSI